MRKHLLSVLIIIFALVLGYGLWLYSESLRTGGDFTQLLKEDLVAKQQTLKDIISNKNK